MSTDTPTERVLEELRFALAQADAAMPPPGLRERVLTVAGTERPAGRPAGAPPAITPVEAYRRTIEAFHTLLGELGDDEWRQPVLRDLDVQGLVGHLIGVEQAFQVVLGMEVAAIDTSDHVAGTQPSAEAQRGRAPDETQRDWLAGARRTLGFLESAELDSQITLHGITLSVREMLIVRSFETWIHEEDIRRATGRPPLVPDAARLALMTALAVTGLPRALRLAGRERPGRTARIVLTGPGGGTWQAALDGGPTAASADVRIVADAVSFCRLVADRLDPSEVHAAITGDQAFGQDVLVAARSLALD